jgi:hypothetical protein
MNRNSDAIDRVLAGLRNVKASAGIEHRVMEAVERRTAQQPAYPWLFGLRHIRSYGLWPLAWGVALGGILAMVSLTVTRQETVKEAVHETSPIAQRPAGHAELRTQPPRVRSRPSGSPLRAHTASPARIPVRYVVPPLTQEEKLLLRIAHTGDPREMAILNPEIRSQQAADSEAQFKRFVEQSTQGDQP